MEDVFGIGGGIHLSLCRKKFLVTFFFSGENLRHSPSEALMEFKKTNQNQMGNYQQQPI